MNTANAPTATPSPAFDAETLAGLNAAFGTTPARTSEGGEQVDTTAIRTILRESASSHDIGARFGGEAANEPAHHCAGILSPDCMTEEQFEAALAAMSRNWNAAVDAFLAQWSAEQLAAEGAK